MAGPAQRIGGDVIQNQDRYTHRELRQLLYLYPYLSLGKPPHNDSAVETLWQNLFGLREGWQTKAARKRGEVQRALEWLNGESQWYCYTVRAAYIVGLSNRDIASYIARIDGRSIHHDTVNEWRKRGFELLLEHLNGER